MYEKVCKKRRFFAICEKPSGPPARRGLTFATTVTAANKLHVITLCKGKADTEWHVGGVKLWLKKIERTYSTRNRSFRSFRRVSHVFVSDRSRPGSRTIREYILNVFPNGFRTSLDRSLKKTRNTCRKTQDERFLVD